MHNLMNFFLSFVGNTTISNLTVKMINRNKGVFHIYCVAKDKVNNDNKPDNEPFQFVSGMFIECWTDCLY